jgi:tellurite resistance protein TerC
VFNRKAHVVKPKEAATWTAVWVSLALAFAAGLLYFYGKDVALTFLTGYLIEEALSVDNIFVIVLIFDYFAVPKAYQHRVLFYGILGALVMRGIFIGVGTLLLAQFHWILYVFGAMLVITGVRMMFKQDEEFDGDNNRIVKVVRRRVPMTLSYHDSKFFVIENGVKLATPLFLVLVLVEFTDLIFAVDSIPAIFGLTQSAFIVFTANIFALMGLRQLYFLLGGLMDRLVYLKHGLSVILAFIGVKLIFHALHENELPFINGGQHIEWIPEITTGLSLGVIIGTLVIATVASLLSPAAKQAKIDAELAADIEASRHPEDKARIEER